MISKTERIVLRTGPSRQARILIGTLIVLGLVVVAALMLRNSLGFVLRKTAPDLALRIDPDNDQVLAGEAELMLRSNPDAAQVARTEQLARRALERSPVSAEAMRMLATAQDMQGDARRARRTITFAERLSRRDLPTQLWLIQDAVDHNDIRDALHHYDVALRGSTVSQALLFPVLEKALGQAPVVEGLTQILSARPVWADDFLREASRHTDDVEGLASLLEGLAARRTPIPAGVLARVGARLVNAGRFEPAWRLYLLDNPHAPRALRDPDFARLGQSDNPFDWRMTGSDGLSAEPTTLGTSGGMSYRVSTGANGIVATQLLLLPPGQYRLRGRADSVVGPAPMLQLICAGGSPIRSLRASDGAFGGDVVIPADCPAQWVRVVLTGRDDATDATGVISAMQIEPNEQTLSRRPPLP